MTTVFNVAFLGVVAIIWFMIAYQFVLTVAGFTLYRKSERESAELLARLTDFPSVTILVPAHNEEQVIEGTIASLLALDYPEDRVGILVIDDASTDRTPEILDRLAARHPRVQVLHRRAPDGGRGKSAALNAGWWRAEGELLAVYDADNRPEPQALKLLVAHLVAHPRLGAALGKFRTLNKRRNLLTRFISIEGLSFQWIAQAGRWQLLKVATLPGTNFVIRRSVVEELRGWDEGALTEDAELSIRVYQHGYRIAFVPSSVTWEQEPETLGVWLKQRTRWVRGNNYVIGKLLRTILHGRAKVLAVEMLHTICLYYLFLFSILASDVVFILGLFGLKVVSIYGPFTAVWVTALVLYVLEIALALAYDDESTPANLLAAVAMYFTYCQAWLVVVCRAFYADFIQRREAVWDKTVRFAPDDVPAAK